MIRLELLLAATAALAISSSAADSSLDDFCKGINAGIFPHPDPHKCYKFISCVFEEPTVYECDEGFVFNVHLSECVPGEWEHCERNQELEKLCSGVSYGVFEYRWDCARFVFCNRGNVSIFECLQEEIWSQERGICVAGDRETCRPEDSLCVGKPDGPIAHPDGCQSFIECRNEQSSVVECPRGHIFVAGGAGCVVGSPRTCASLEHLCRGNSSVIRHPHPDFCDLYIVCNGDRAAIAECGANEIFRPDIRFCIPGDPESCVSYRPEEACVGRPDGIVPHPDECNQFIVCTGGVSSVINCPIGEIFRPEASQCVAGDSETCELLDGICVGRPNGFVIRHPNYCGSFIRCQNGQAEVHSCPAGEILRPDMQVCVPGNVNNCTFTPIQNMCDGRQGPVIYPHPDSCYRYVRCEQGNITIHSCPSEMIVEPRTIQCVPGDQESCVFHSDLCVGRPDGIIPHPLRCYLFVECRSELVIVSSCPAGHIFDVTKAICIPGNTETCARLDEYCDDRLDGVFPHPNQCNLFITCTNGLTTVNQCPAGEILRPDMQVCVPGDLNNCTYTPIDEMCDGRQGPVIYPHPQKCDQYVRCEHGDLFVNTCPPESIVRPGTLECAPGNPETCKLFDELCLTHPNAIIPHPSRCDVFIDCRSGSASVSACPDGHIFLNSTSSCVPGNTETCSRLDQTCIGREDANLPHPNGCHLYVSCRSGVTTVHRCPEGEILRPDMQVCVPGDRETCQFTPINGMCNNRPGPVAYPHPDNCTLLVRCDQGQVSIESCREGTVLQPRTLECVPGNRNTCQLYIDRCVGVPDGTIPHPSECHLRLRCSSGTASVESCPRGTIYNTDGRCVLGDRDTCESLEQICATLGMIVIAHPNFCDLSVECRDGTSTLRTCAAGLIFHRNMQVCSPGDVSTCRLDEINEMCDGRNQGRFPLPDQSECIDYVTCANGVPAINSCRDGTVLRPRFLDCVPGNNDTCEFFPHICLFRPNENIPHPIRCDLFVECISEMPHVVSCPEGTIYSPEADICLPGSAETCEFHTGRK